MIKYYNILNKLFIIICLTFLVKRQLVELNQ